MYPQVLSLVLEKLIAQAMALDPKIAPQLSAIAGQSLLISLQELPFQLQFLVSNEQIFVLAHPKDSDIKCDCYLSTSIATLFELKAAQQLTQLIKADKLNIEGNLKLAQQLANIAESLEIDWQSECAKHIGDIATYKLTRLGNNLAEKITFVKNTIEADASQWLLHEKKLLVSQAELSGFNQGVEELTDKISQLTQRLSSLEALINQSNNSQGSA